MNLLIIGNGFDLAHGLPTYYTDFLKFVNEANDYYNNFYLKKIEVPEEDKKNKDFFDFFIALNQNSDFETIIELYELSSDNLWFKYFNNISNQANTWIDFESEISRFIRILESLKEEKDFAILYNKDDFIVPQIFSHFLKNIGWENTVFTERNFKNELVFTFPLSNYFILTEKLSNDLNNLTRCLEIYLSKYINNLDKGLRIPEILELKDKINVVLSFNYTNTFERLYGHESVRYDYIHGKADIENTVDSCQLVLGIDEYLDEKEKSNNIDFIQYKKYFQRIYKRTGRKHIDWLKKLNRSNGIDLDELNIYILGHSLDITDKDILYPLIMFGKQENLGFYSSVNIIVYDHDKKASFNHIANLVKVITQDELIDSVYSKDGKEARIVFRPQSESINIYDTEDQ